MPQEGKKWIQNAYRIKKANSKEANKILYSQEKEE